MFGILVFLVLACIRPPEGGTPYSAHQRFGGPASACPHLNSLIYFWNLIAAQSSFASLADPARDRPIQGNDLAHGSFGSSRALLERCFSDQQACFFQFPSGKPIHPV